MNKAADKLMRQAAASRQRGDLATTAALLTRVVGLEPKNAAALNDLAVALQGMGRIGEALAYYQAAANEDPNDPTPLGNMGGALFAVGALEQAADAFVAALALDGRNAALLNNFALTLQAMGRTDDAAACFDAACAADPKYAPPRDNLGSLLTMRGKPAAAVPQHLAAVALDPLRANAWNNLGNALSMTGDKARAARAWRRALAIEPIHPEGWVNLGVGLTGAEDFPAASCALRRALRLTPDSSAAWNNLGDARRLTDGEAASMRRYQRAAALEPTYAEAWSNMGLSAQKIGDMRRGERLFDRALRINPELAGARFNRGLLKLETGRVADGWPDYAYRFASGKVGRGRAPAMAPWRGERLAPGQKLLVWREQGLGDEILFASMYRDLLARGVDAVFECDPRLTGLLSRALPGGVTVRGETVDARGRETLVQPDCARHIPAGSLARLLRGRVADFPSQAPWSAPDPVLAARLRERLEAACGDRLRVGLAWRSGLMTAERSAAYLRLSDYAPLFALPGVAWVNLQYGDCAAEIAAAEACFGVRIETWPDLDLKNDLESAAALTVGLDLVITPAVSVGETAAALGVPVWRLGARDWTQLGTDARPWTPTLRVFSPRPGEKLSDAVHRAAKALAGMAPLRQSEKPTEPDPRRSVNAATACLSRGDRGGAAAHAESAAVLDPALPEALTLLGATRNAVFWHRRALAAQPGHPTALTNLGRALADDGAWRPARNALRRACVAAPHRAGGYVNLAHVERFCGDGAAAETAADRALRLDPAARAAQANRALLRLARGDLAGGWADYGARLNPPSTAPVLADFAGRVAEVIAEQGLGDEILFAVCLPDLAAVAAGVRLVCDRRLVGLFARSFPGIDVRPHGTPEPFPAEVTVRAGDLPRLFRRELAAFPSGVFSSDAGPLLRVEPQRQARWARALTAAGPGLKVGIAWTSGLARAERQACRTRLADWRPLATAPGVTPVALQYGDVEAEIAAAEAAWGVKILRWPGPDLKDDLEEVAALTAALDLVVTIPSGVGELAAAAGAPTWRLTPPGDWTLLGGGVRPWFPAQRVIAPPPGGDLVAAITTAARFLHAARRRGFYMRRDDAVFNGRLREKTLP
jgi:tetratricopeptide (TPR) repeat protein